MHNSQEVSNAIKELAKKKNIAVGKMLNECGLSKNTLSSMQSGGYLPRIENIVKIADYLDCSVDYLLGRSYVENKRLTEGVDNLSMQYAALNVVGKNKLDSYLSDLLDNSKYTNNTANIADDMAQTIKKEEKMFTRQSTQHNTK